MNDGAKNLNTFKILFIIKGVLAILFVFLFLFYVTMGRIMGGITRQDPNFGRVGIDPSEIFVTIGVIGMIFFATMAILAFIAAKKLNDREGHTLIIVAAVVNIFSGVLGLVLCIFTIIELMKPEVKAVFDGTDTSVNNYNDGSKLNYSSSTEEII
ncbi:MAG: hypothetical protein MK078_13605 [Crocinitomicaceae bacterium]|nr:hypothetical protein [Crocinitomicaceae bacterium]